MGFDEALGFIALVVVVGAVGIALGMLVVAPRLTRLSNRDEEPGDRTEE